MTSEEANFRRILSKVQRALRNKTGCQFSYDELVLLLHSPVWPALVAAEQEELRAQHPKQEEAVDVGRTD